MSAGIPEVFKVDFSIYARDMSAKVMQRILSQFHDSPVLQEFIKVFMREGAQYIYDKIIAFQEANTLYMAEGENLDAIGRIVGQPRIPYQFNDGKWFFTDRAGQGMDQGNMWVSDATLSGNTPATDAEYRMMILARIACNFCRFASIPELQYLAKFITGEDVSWRVTGPMEAQLIVRSGISRTKTGFLTKFTTTTYADDIPMIPYPATLKISSILYMGSPKPFMVDRGDGHQIDAGSMSISVPF